MGCSCFPRKPTRWPCRWQSSPPSFTTGFSTEITENRGKEKNRFLASVSSVCSVFPAVILYRAIHHGGRREHGGGNNESLPVISVLSVVDRWGHFWDYLPHFCRSASKSPRKRSPPKLASCWRK